MDMDQVRDRLLAVPNVWPEMAELWVEATKKPRPDWGMAMVAAQAVGGDIAFDEAAIVAAVGAAQTSIILIDDILDNEADGAQQKYGVGGTANLAAAFQAAAIGLASSAADTCDRAMAAVDLLNGLMYGTAVGQRLDIDNPDTEAAYWEMVRAKSGPFYGHSMELGAVLQDAPLKLRLQMRELGTIVGEMVQIRDDLTDSMAEEATPDWTEGRANLVLLYGRVADYEKKGRFFGLVQGIGATRYNEGLLTEAQQILIEIGAVDYCLHKLEEKQAQGLAILDEMALADDAELRHLLEELSSVLSLD